MPRAKSICLRAACTSVTVRDGRCAAHQVTKSWDRVSARNATRPRDWTSRRSKVLARDHFACVQCGTRTELEVDHIVPVARGGSWDLDNLQTLCRSHHRQKTYYEDR